MSGDDEIIETYEQELALDDVTPTASNRRFWLVMAAFAVACAFTLVEIFANLGIKESIAHAQHTLRAAQQTAESIADRGGTFAAADANGMATASDVLSFVGPDAASTGLDEVSVAAGLSEWAAAVQVRPGACFYLHIAGDAVTYGAGTDCTARAALQAEDGQW